MTERAARGLVDKKPAPQRPIPRSTTGDGIPCPTNPEHGQLLSIGQTGFYSYCPNQEHDGRLNSHPLGGSPLTKSVWRREELDKLAEQ